MTLIRYRRLTAEHSKAIQRGTEALESLADRLAFVRPPYDLANVARSADAFGADLLLLDYIQRIGAHGEHADRRGAVDATMGSLRQFADAGVAIVVVAALARSKDAKGRSSYNDGLSLASFRETSELEYGADDAFILAPANDGGDGAPSSRVILKHLKSRHGESRDIRPDLRPEAPAVHSGRAPRDREAWTEARQRQASFGPSSPLESEPSGQRQRRGRAVSEGSNPPARRKTPKRVSRLRFELLNAFVDSGMADLSRGELAVWLILYRDTKPGGTARASLGDIARRAGIDRQTASRAVGRLARRKMLQVLRRGGLNQGPSEYRIFPFPMD